MAYYPDMVVVQVKIVNGNGWYKILKDHVFTCYKGTSDYVLKDDYDRGHDHPWCHIDFADGIEIEKESEQ